MREEGLRGWGLGLEPELLMLVPFGYYCVGSLDLSQGAVDLCMSCIHRDFAILKAKLQVRSAAGLLMTLRAVGVVAVALILSLSAAAGEQQYPDAVTVFRCGFGEDWDVNYDQWPDRWVRKTGLGYPHYVNIGIQEDSSAAALVDFQAEYCRR